MVTSCVCVISPVCSLLTVPDNVVTTPPVQYALYGSTYHLQCNVTDGHPASVTWLDSDDSVVDDVIEEVTLDHEGHYRCRVFLHSTHIQTEKSVQLFVIGRSHSCW